MAKNISLDQYRHFLAAAEYLHIGKAASVIGISQSVISRSIAVIEQEFNDKMFDRRNRRVFLTQKGSLLKNKVSEIISQIDNLSIGLDSKSIKGKYKLAASHSICDTFITPLCMKLLKQHDHLKFDLKALDTKRIIDEVLMGYIDIGICFSPKNHPDLTAYKIWEGQQKLAVKKGHPILKTKKSWSLLNDYPAVLHGITEAHNIESYAKILKIIGVTSDTRMSFDHGKIAQTALANSNAWSILPEFLINADKKLEILPGPKEWNLPINISVIAKNSLEGDLLLEAIVEDSKKVF